jgi:Rad3-related DNA helicase
LRDGVTPIGRIYRPGKAKTLDLKEEEELSENLRKYFRHPTTRPYQADLANVAYESLKADRHMVVEAPTGLGKTAAVWSAVKAYASENRLRILWLTRTASQVRQVSYETGATPVYGSENYYVYTRLFRRLSREGLTKHVRLLDRPEDAHTIQVGRRQQRLRLYQSSKRQG